jgi:hypothetical protein
VTELSEDAHDEDTAVARADEELGAEGLIQRAIDVVGSAKAMPLSASVLVSREELQELLHAAQERLPDELRQARWLLREKEEFLADRGREAEALMADVRAQAEHMVSRSEVVRQANLVAQRILDDANEEARRMRHETEDYCDQRLAGMEIVLDRTMKTVRSGRQKLQAISSPAERQRAQPAVSEADDESDAESFFDQDRT